MTDSRAVLWCLKALDRDLIRTLCDLQTERPPNAAIRGTDVHRALGEHTGAEITASSVYHRLDELANRGLVKKQSRIPDERSNSYTLTERGLKFAIAYRRTVDDHLGGAEQLLDGGADE